MKIKDLKTLIHGMDNDLEIIFEDNDSEILYFVDTCGIDKDDNGNTYVFFAGYEKKC